MKPVSTTSAGARFAARIQEELQRRGLTLTRSAIDVLKVVVDGQIIDGIVQDELTLTQLLSSVPVSELVTLYEIKYGHVDLNVNRTVRWLGDLHDRWVRVRLGVA